MGKKIVFLGMGGTIAGKAANPADNVGYKAAQVGVADLLSAVPALAASLGAMTAVAEQVAQIDSKDMHNAAWRALAHRAAHHLAQPDVAGVVVTHGTDTLEETAFFLAQVLPEALRESKPVVLTCAMRPASSQAPDGPQNMADATAVACTPGARGVMAVCAGVIHDAVHLRKVHPYRLDPFESGEAGPLGFVEEGRVRLLHGWALSQPAAATLEALAQPEWPRVEVVTSHAGASGAGVRSMVAHPGDALVRGIVVAGTGNGSLHQDLEAALLEVQAQGVRVLRGTRCVEGPIVGHPRGASTGLPVTLLDPIKARIALMLSLLATDANA
jgi:L-asparaginase